MGSPLQQALMEIAQWGEKGRARDVAKRAGHKPPPDPDFPEEEPQEAAPEGEAMSMGAMEGAPAEGGLTEEDVAALLAMLQQEG